MIHVLGMLAYILLAVLVWASYEYLYKALRSPLRRHLPGPRVLGFFKNHMLHTLDPRISARAQEQWFERFGPNMVIKGYNWFDNRLLTLDPRAVTYILNNPLQYEKPWLTQRLLSSLIGAGLLASEGPHNRRQRKVMNPAFSGANLRALTPIFFRKAYELRQKWKSLAAETKNANLNVSHWLSRATFDVIGLAGFDYEFNAIEEENEPIYRAYKVMFDATVNQGEKLTDGLFLAFPWLSRLLRDTGRRITDESQATIYKFGMGLVEQRKNELRSGDLKRLDLLSLLVRSNMSSDTPPSQKIKDNDIANQINTFLFAGSDTTSIGISWALYMLAQKPDIQDELRAELSALAPQYSEDNVEDNAVPLHTAIDKLPYLDKFCREILRLIPPVHSTIRVALKDDIIPVSAPLRYESGPWAGKERVVSGIHIAKGESIHIPIEGFNVAKHIWGDDAHEFHPERWDNLPSTSRSSPGLYSNLLTFGAGPRSCIGMKFSMMEMKSMMFVLVPAFKFDEVVEIRKVNVLLTRPYVKGSFSEGTQLPLSITPL